ncbi:MAG: hypothetical protein WBP46_01155 [Thiolinea sp.]
MASTSTLYPLAGVLHELSAALSSQQSGIFLIATEQNTSCRFAIAEGKITHCTHSRDKGAAAVLSLLQVEQAACSFSVNLMLPFRAEAAVDHDYCVQTLNLSEPVLAEPIEALSEMETEVSTANDERHQRFYRGAHVSTPSTATETQAAEHSEKSTLTRRNRFYRGGQALGENDPTV